MSGVTYIWCATLMTFGLCILSCALSQAQTINVTIEEGKDTSFQCKYRYLETIKWNMTVAGNVLTVATCENGQCNIDLFYSKYISGINTLYGRPVYEMSIKSVYRTVTKVQCYSTTDPMNRKTWLLNVIVLPMEPKCESPSEEPNIKDNFYILTISCETYVFPTANCSLEVKGNMEIYNTQVTYIHSFSHLTNLYTTTCMYILSLYATTLDGIDSEFQVSAYPSTYEGKKYTVTSPWLPFFPEVPTVEERIYSFTLNGLSSSITVGCGDKVTIRCKGEGRPGRSIQLYDGSPDVLLENWELPMEIYHIFNIENSCGSRHTLGCIVGSEEQTLILTINSWSKDGSNSSYLIAVVVTLSVAIVITALIIFCYIRMRLRRKRAAMANRRTPHRLYPHDLPDARDIQPSAPPSYHEIFFIDVTGEPVDLPEYWSLPPPYSEHPDPQLPKTTSNEYTNVSPIMTSQEVRSTYAETPPEVTSAALQQSRGAPSASPQVGIASTTSQEVRGVPSATSLLRGVPSVTSQEVRGVPSSTSQEVRVAGSAASQDVRSASSARPRNVKGATSAAMQVVRDTYSETSKEVKDAPSEKCQEVRGSPGETSQELKDASFATSQV